MAQRMESVAPPGGVMLSASTARLVDDAATLGMAVSLDWELPRPECTVGLSAVRPRSCSRSGGI